MTSTSSSTVGAKPGMLAGLRVIEFADELGEYCGLMLAGLGAEVVKIEPPDGSSDAAASARSTRTSPGRENSLYFWNYNRGKRSVVLRPGAGGARPARAHRVADILLDSSCGALNARPGAGSRGWPRSSRR